MRGINVFKNVCRIVGRLRDLGTNNPRILRHPGCFDLILIDFCSHGAKIVNTIAFSLSIASAPVLGLITRALRNENLNTRAQISSSFTV